MSKYYDAKEVLEDSKCEMCDGEGVCDDAEPGDISYNAWQCPDCHGIGFAKTNRDDLINKLKEALK